MCNGRPACQDACIRDASLHVPRLSVLIMRTREHFRRHGFGPTAARIAAYFKSRLVSPSPAISAAAATHASALNLQPGEVVEVRTMDEIRLTLDSNGRSRGLGFMEGMARYCGKKLRVYKRAQTILLEGSGEVRKLRNSVLLEGAICDGEHFVCDRSCFYFWKESWLKRVSPEESSRSN